MQLLYVDDDRVNLLLFEAACQALPGLQVATAASADEALACVHTVQPDVLVIDLHLPDLDGLALLRALRASAGLDATPAFLCSADDDATLPARALAAGFSGCWSKPLDQAQLAGALAALPRPGR